MPRLGGSDEEEEGIPLMMAPSGNRRRDREATAYATASGGGLLHLATSPIVAALKLLTILFGVLVVRNMLAHVSVFDLFEGPTFWMQ